MIKSSSCNFDCATPYLEFRQNFGKGFLRQLPFKIKLNKFIIDNYPTTSRMYLVHFNHKIKSYQATASWNINEIKKDLRLEGTDFVIKQISEVSKGMYKLEVKNIIDNEEKVLDLDARSPNIAKLDQSMNALTVRQDGTQVKEYLSKITLEYYQNSKVQNYNIRVNHPLTFGSYYIYQSSYDKQNKDLSIFEIVYDPGVHYVFTGFFLLTIGIATSLFFRVKKNNWVKV